MKGLMKTGIELITDERQRQLVQEGWTPEHDDAHDDGELARAGAWYALASLSCQWNDTCGVADRDSVAHRLFRSDFYGWPWFDTTQKYGDPQWFKDAGPNSGLDGILRNLQKSGALIAAEIDRIQRLRARTAP